MVNDTLHEVLLERVIRMENNELQHRPLGVVKDLLESLGAEISYAYDDLIFVKHNHFLLQFGKTAEEVFFFRNVEIEAKESHQQHITLSAAGKQMGLQIPYAGEYSLAENDDGTLSIHFLDTDNEK